MGWRTLSPALLLCAALVHVIACGSDAAAPGSRTGRALLANHKFQLHDSVVLYANKVGPFHNPRCAPLLILTAESRARYQIEQTQIPLPALQSLTLSRSPGCGS